MLDIKYNFTRGEWKLCQNVQKFQIIMSKIVDCNYKEKPQNRLVHCLFFVIW